MAQTMLMIMMTEADFLGKIVLQMVQSALATINLLDGGMNAKLPNALHI